MTDDRLPLAELLAKSGDEDFLRSVAEAVLQIIMEADVEGLVGAGRHERSAERSTWRNGYRDRTLETRLGPLSLRVPKLRTGSYFPGFLEPRKPVEKALVAVIQEAWIAGVSTRKVDDLVQAMGMSGISKSSVSKLCRDIDERVGAFLGRTLEGEWPYLWLDATYLKVREGGRIVSVAAIVAVAVNTDGRREIVGLHIGPSEAETFWSAFLKTLAKRGLKGTKLVISDAHEGLKAAIARTLTGATWQRCRVHFMRNALAHVPRSQTTVVAAAIRQAFVQPDHASATRTWRHVADQLRARWPKLGALMDGAEADVLAYVAFPMRHRAKLHSTNPLERLNKEIKRRADVVGIFPNEDSITRLVGAVLLEANDDWQLQHRYMQVEGMVELVAPQLEEDSTLQITPAAA
jgi:transposase-like protein